MFQDNYSRNDVFDICYYMTTSLVTRPMANRLGKVRAKLYNAISDFESNLKSTLGNDFSFHQDDKVKLVSKMLLNDKDLKDTTDSFQRHYKT